jgi:hypothetical protein
MYRTARAGLRKDADLIVDTTALRAVEAAHLIADAWFEGRFGQHR